MHRVRVAVAVGVGPSGNGERAQGEMAAVEEHAEVGVEQERVPGRGGAVFGAGEQHGDALADVNAELENDDVAEI